MTRQIKFCQQTNNFTCAHAAIAMIAGVPVEEVIGSVRFDGRGMTKRERVEALQHFGCRPVVQRFNELHTDRAYTITVPSLNKLGGIHSIVIDRDYRVLDPNYGRKGLRVYDVITDMIGWGDVIRVTPQFPNRQARKRKTC